MLSKRRVGSLLAVLCTSLFAEVSLPDGCQGPELCSSLPETCYGATFDVGLIYEQMRLSNAGICTEFTTGLGTVIVPPIGAVGSPTTTDVFINYDFDMEPGLRAALGYDIPFNGWRLMAGVEWLPSTASFNGPAKSGVLYRPTDQQVIFFDYNNADEVKFQEASASLEIDYYLLDVTLSRGSYFSGNFTLDPFAGLKASWIYYKMNKQFKNDQNNSDPTDPMPLTTSWARKAKVDFWGVGPEVGINTNYIIGCGVSIFSSSNLSVLFGESALLDYSGFITVPATPGYSKVEDNLNVMSTTLRNVFGLQLDREFFCGSQRWLIRAGMDGRLYYNQFPVVERLGGLLAVQGSPGLITNPYIRVNNAFGMIGLLLEVAWDF